MAALYIPKTAKTPMIQFNPDNGQLQIKGVSIPENANAFYQPLVDALKQFSENPSGITITFDLKYFNSSTSRIFYSILKDTALIKEKGCNVTINWIYDADDEEAGEAGKTMANLSKVDINLISRA